MLEIIEEKMSGNVGLVQTGFKVLDGWLKINYL